MQTLASGSSGNAYIVTDGTAPLLLEAGISIKELRRKSGFSLGRLEACLISHEHQDHAKATWDVLRAGVGIYASQGTIEALGMRHHRLHVVQHGEPFQAGTWTIVPFDLIHDAAEPLGFLCSNNAGEKLLFATDTHYIRNRFRGLTHIAVECNFDPDILRANVANGAVNPEVGRRLWARHMSLPVVKDFLTAQDLSRVQEIHLLHLSDKNADAGQFQKAIERLTGIPTMIA